jgi:glycogen synthase
MVAMAVKYTGAVPKDFLWAVAISLWFFSQIYKKPAVFTVHHINYEGVPRSNGYLCRTACRH